MKKFRTWDDEIDEVEIIKETKNFVTESDGRKWAKRNENFRNYFDTWEEAHDFLVRRETYMIMDLKRQITRHEKTLKEIEEMVR